MSGDRRRARLQTKSTAVYAAGPAFAPGFFAKAARRRRSVALRRRRISRRARFGWATKIDPRLSAFVVGPLVEISGTVFAVGTTRETLENEWCASTQSSASPPRRFGRFGSGVENIFGTRPLVRGHTAGIISHRFAARFLESSLYPRGRERIFLARAHRQFPCRGDSRQCGLSAGSQCRPRNLE